MSYETLSLEERDTILTVTLERSERLNALNEAVLEDLYQCFRDLDRRFETRAVILRGAGRAFSAGADRKTPPGRERLGSDTVGAREKRYWTQIGRRAMRAIEESEIPTVAAVQGYAIGGGACLAIACDFRVFTEDAVFHIPEVDLGIPLTWGATPRLIHEVGAARARELILLSDPIDGRRAGEWGVAHRVVPAADLEEEARALAQRLAEKPPLAVHMTKTQFRSYGEAQRHGTVAETDGDLVAAVFHDPDFRAAFSGLPGSGSGER